MKSFLTIRNATLALVVIGLLFLAISGYLTPLTRIAVSPVVGVQTWISIRYQAIRDFFTAPRDIARLTQQNQQLEAEVAQLESTIIDLQQQNAELKVLSALLDFPLANPENKYVTASVIGQDPSPFFHYIIINRGSDDGLKRGMPVVSSQGLVGRVAAVTSNAARVQLITDPAMVINVRLEPSGAEAMLRGSITGDLTIEAIAQDSNVQIGDLCLTSGLGGSYPPDLLIGQVETVRQLPGELFQSASVQPVVDFSQLKIVLVIVNFRPIDIAPLIPTPGTP